MNTIRTIGVFAMILAAGVAGAEWSSVESGINSRLWSVSAPSAEQVWACDDNGSVWHSEDGGWTWAESVNFTMQDFRGIDFADEQFGTVAAFGGNVYKTSDGGATWDTILDGWWIYHHDVFAVPGTDEAYVAGKNTINQPLVTYTSNEWASNDGWNFLIDINDVGNEGQIVGFARAENGNMIAACRTWTGEGALVVSLNDGMTWETMLTGFLPFNDVAVRGDLAVAVDAGGVIYRSQDSGASWDAVYTNDFTLNDVCFASASELWAVGEGGVLLHSIDGGENWSGVDLPVGDTLQNVSFSDEGHGVAVGDNGTVLVYEGAPAGPVVFDVIPTSDWVPSEGGTVVYEILLESSLAGSFPGVSYWTFVNAPNGNAYGPLAQQTFTLQPFMDVWITGAMQVVPGFAPDGEYQFVANLGYFPNAQLTSDFDFFKGGEGTADGTPPATGWDSEGIDFTVATTGETAGKPAVPDRYSLSEAWPNPFNPAATMTITLPESADLTVRLVNVQGRTVATLADGVHHAGAHRLTVNGADLPSGVYFVQATVPGRFQQVRKLTLLK